MVKTGALMMLFSCTFQMVFGSSKQDCCITTTPDRCASDKEYFDGGCCCSANQLSDKSCACEAGSVAVCRNGTLSCEPCKKDHYRPYPSFLHKENTDACFAMDQCTYEYMYTEFEGNATHNRVCGCSEGRKYIRHKCPLDPKSSSTTIDTAADYETETKSSTNGIESTVHNGTSVSPENPQSESNNLELIIGSVCGVIIIIIIIIISIIIWKKRHAQSSSSNNQMNNRHPNVSYHAQSNGAQIGSSTTEIEGEQQVTE